MWIDKNKNIFLLRDMPFRSAVSSNPQAYSDSVFSVIQSSFHHFDVFKENSIGLSEMWVIPFSEDSAFSYNKQLFPTSYGDCLITTVAPEDLDIDQSKILPWISFYYNKEKTKVGSGSKQFEVTCIVRDHYTVKVFAETESEAVSLAKNISPEKWEHIIIDNELEEVHMVRMGRWGNFRARRI
jgi:hypothetical protein